VRLTTTAKRAAAIAVAAATLALGAATSAQAAVSGGSKIIGSGGCSVDVVTAGGGIIFHPVADNGRCLFGVLDQTRSSFIEPMGPLSNVSQWPAIVPPPGDQLEGCFLDPSVSTTLSCYPIN
jgi:hypothetical protein